MSEESDALDLLEAFTQAHGAPGHEDAVRALVRRRLPGFRFEHDRLGGLVARPPAERDGPLVALSAHMDEVGFLVQSVTADGFLQFVPLGGWWSHTLPSQRVRVLTSAGQEVVGVVTATPPHLLGEEARQKVVPMEKLFIDIGAKDRAQAVEAFGVRIGDPIVPDAPFLRLHNPDRLAAKAFDNRAGVACLVQALLRLAGEPLSCRVAGLATVQEEVGTRGAKVAGDAVRPDVVVVLEGPPADDTPGLPAGESQGKLGGGVQIRVMDPTALMNRRLVNLCRATAQAEGIPHQLAVRRSGGTDAAAFQYAGNGTPVVVLGVPARYIHTHNAIISLADYLAMVRLVMALCRRLDAGAVAALSDFS